MTDRAEVVRALDQLVRESPIDALPDLLADLERERAIGLLRLARPEPAAEGGDQLLEIEAAAERLSVTEDWLKRRPDLPFVRKLSAGVVRYSTREMDRWLRQRAR